MNCTWAVSLFILAPSQLFSRLTTQIRNRNPSALQSVSLHSQEGGVVAEC